jgi:K(+)-stimulated pyrophosphate-energized sodium pump
MVSRVRRLKISTVAQKLAFCAIPLFILLFAAVANASEAELKIPDLRTVSFLGTSGHNLLVGGLVICFLGMGFGFIQFLKIKNLPVHKAMLEISELIYETCKTYLITQGKFIAILWAFIAAIMVVYFSFLLHYATVQVVIIVIFSIVGILGSYGVAWFGIRINTYANSRTAFASLGGKPYPTMTIPLGSGMPSA